MRSSSGEINKEQQGTFGQDAPQAADTFQEGQDALHALLYIHTVHPFFYVAEVFT